jgi:hypothetical protein
MKTERDCQVWAIRSALAWPSLGIQPKAGSDWFNAAANTAGSRPNAQGWRTSPRRRARAAREYVAQAA